MNENKKVELINIIFSILVIFSCFFTGYLFDTEPMLSTFLLVCGIIVSQVRAIPSEEEE
jgi:ABC-type multidrug transport system permease subunit